MNVSEETSQKKTHFLPQALIALSVLTIAEETQLQIFRNLSITLYFGSRHVNFDDGELFVEKNNYKMLFHQCTEFCRDDLKDKIDVFQKIFPADSFRLFAFVFDRFCWTVQPGWNAENEIKIFSASILYPLLIDCLEVPESYIFLYQLELEKSVFYRKYKKNV